MKEEELIKKLEELRYPEIEVESHKRRLKTALVSSKVFRRQRMGDFFRMSSRGVEMSVSRRILIPAGMVVLLAVAVIWGAGSFHAEQGRVLTTEAVPASATGEGQPFLRIIEPMDNATVNGSIVSIQGKTEPGAVVSINDEMTVADEQGDFSIDLSVDPGINVINITVSNDSGGQATTTIVANSQEGA